MKKEFDVMDGERTLVKVRLEAPKIKSTRPLLRKHESDAGWDIESIEDIVVSAQEFVPKIHTGVHLEIPDRYFGLIKERSSMAAQGVFVMGGVIDAGYRGEIMINLGNISGYDYVIKSGDRIAQIIFIPCDSDLTLEDELSESDRGQGGFGSTGR